ncbi:hypothetical protein [Erythrobacter litoralis]|uniref:DUF11 domain-containing protein n=1 Tax=Erythrobacter litoralis (strain HTCC2594) TaxID=314225 RepID=Q2NAG3_ERYLH|nr:hypothetical protein [Erythrobacter litoralis]ABC63328.1 hypothetical protein ELI_06180 [Erythrobacter litoralis HTCC2594]
MFDHKFVIASMFAASVAFSTPSFAQTTVELQGDVKVVRIVEEAGKRVETYAEPTQVVPGDRLKFTTSYRNGTSELVENFVITNPLPKAVLLTDAGDFEVSVDGGETFGPLESRTVSLPEGGSRPAMLADVEQVRWTIASIAPGASGQVTYFASVR